MKFLAALLVLIGILCNASADKLAYVGRKKQADIDNPWNLDIYLLDTKTGQNQRLTSHYLHDYNPTLSPDGKKLAFITEMWRYYPDQHGEAQLALMDLATRKIERIDIGRDQWAAEPVFSRDSQVLYFTKAPIPTNVPTNRSYQIYSYDINSKVIKQLTDQPYQNHFDLAMSPNGAKIAYRHAHKGEQVLKLFDIASGLVEDFNFGQPFAAHLFHPSWRDNDRITFHARYGKSHNPFYDSAFEVSRSGGANFEQLFADDDRIKDPQEICWLDADRGFLTAKDEGDEDYEIYYFDTRQAAMGLKQITQREQQSGPGNNDMDCLAGK